MVLNVMGQESLKRWAKIMCLHTLFSQAQSHMFIAAVVDHVSINEASVTVFCFIDNEM